MKQVCEEILSSGGIASVEDRIGTIKDRFGLLTYDELRRAEQAYGPATRDPARNVR